MKLKLFIYLLVLPISNALANDVSGKTIIARGDVNADAGSESRQLKRRSPVYQVDKITTGMDSMTQLRMADGGLLALQQQSELEIASYEFNKSTNEGNVSMSLLKGGLRTVTGALKSNTTNYHLITPVASMGVRGTHYEVELVGDDMFIAVWEGIVDINTTVGSLTEFSLGPELSYRFAIVDNTGFVEFLLDAPDVFAKGHASVTSAQSNNTNSESSNEEPILSGTALEENSPEVAANDIEIQAEQEPIETGESIFDNDRLVADIQPEDLDTNTRSGSVTFSQISESSLVSSLGNISSASISLTLDFDTARVPDGMLSIVDPAGEWFAVFNGVFDEEGLDLNVNFASHGNNLAQGEIGGLVVDGATAILGQLSLSEVENPQAQLEGAFLITE